MGSILQLTLLLPVLIRPQPPSKRSPSSLPKASDIADAYWNLLTNNAAVLNRWQNTSITTRFSQNQSYSERSPIRSGRPISDHTKGRGGADSTQSDGKEIFASGQRPFRAD
ncbi:hypothetical protein DPMN_094139 [Dreissena polymorpha]|uniref:Secreted protein n=1 Tax=Dreissena polymorpha TaxID=45954 RepID=A0A9D4R1K2_DREPO|nr:hypothetical protein DPMN_094139 [Dreissena polymorpha]